MQYLAVLASLLAATTTASPVESRQTTAPAYKCADWGKGFGGSLILGPTDANASRCCVYGESTALCCRNDPALAADPVWKNALECSNPYWANITVFGNLYSCNVNPDNFCSKDCAGVPWVHNEPRNCAK